MLLASYIRQFYNSNLTVILARGLWPTKLPTIVDTSNEPSITVREVY